MDADAQATVTIVPIGGIIAAQPVIAAVGLTITLPVITPVIAPAAVPVVAAARSMAVIPIASVDPAIPVVVNSPVDVAIVIAIVTPVDSSVPVVIKTAVYPAIAVAVAAPDILTPVDAIVSPIGNVPFLPDGAILLHGAPILPDGAILLHDGRRLLHCAIEIAVLSDLALYNPIIAPIIAIGVKIAIHSFGPAVLPGFGKVSAGLEAGLTTIIPIFGALCPELTISAIGATFAAIISLQGGGAGQVNLNQSGRASEIGRDFGGGCGGGRQHRGCHHAGD